MTLGNMRELGAPLLGKFPQMNWSLRPNRPGLPVAILCLSLGACAGTEFEPVNRTDAPDPSTIQSVVADEVRNAKMTGTPQVSELRETTGPEPGDWMVCFKTDGSEQAVRYAVLQMLVARATEPGAIRAFQALDPQLRDAAIADFPFGVVGVLGEDQSVEAVPSDRPADPLAGARGP